MRTTSNTQVFLPFRAVVLGAIVLRVNQHRAGREGSEKRDGIFPTTIWEGVRTSTAALNNLFSRYRQPLLVHLRGLNYSHHDAEDLLHGFLAHLLERDFLKNVAASKGRFRTFLLTALDYYRIDEFEKTIAAKRGGGQKLESLQETTPDGQPRCEPPASDPAADVQYDIAWGKAVLANALGQLRVECARSGHASLFDALEPGLFGDEDALKYREIADLLKMTEAAVKQAAHRMRARLRFLIRDEIRQTVNSDAEWEEECAYLLSLFH